jgi:hypothetical protein
MHVWNGRRLTLAVCILAILLETTGSSQRFLVDDSVLTTDSPAAVDAKREAMIAFLWGDDGFPSDKLPSSVLIGTGSDHEVPVSPRPPNLERVDTLTITMSEGQTGYAHHFIPQIKNDRLVILHQGHGASFDDEASLVGDYDQGVERTLRALLGAGYSVLAVYMPHTARFDINEDPLLDVIDVLPAHDELIATVTPSTGSALKYFFEPLAVSLNYLKTRASADGFPRYLEYDMVGLSGGGWTTTVYAALDPTIKISIPVAGTLQLYMRDPIEGDEEQFHQAFYEMVGYLDLYAMASTGPGRYHLQILNRYDDCCFGELAVRPNPETYVSDIAAYRTSVQQAVAVTGGGAFEVFISESTIIHEINAEVRQRILTTLSPPMDAAASAALPSRAATPITWTATTVADAPSPLEYQFWLRTVDGDWRVVKDFSPVTNFTWTPAVKGDYELQVRARIVGSHIPYHAASPAASFTITDAAAVKVTSVTSSLPFPQPAGTTITWTAAATGGVNPLQYQFWLLDPMLGWTMLQDYSPASSITWTPLRYGVYALQVWVRAAGSTSSYDAWSGSGYVTVTPAPLRVVSLTTDKVLPVAVNTPMTWTAATNGSTPLEYQFWRFETTGWSMVQDFSPLASYTWAPAAVDRFHLQVWVRRQGSTVEYEAYRSTEAFESVNAPVQLTSFTPNQPFPIATDSRIVWTVRATGGSAPLEYKFYLYDRTAGTWSIAQDWSPSPRFAWTPTRAEFGIYAIQVHVRSTGAPVAYETYAAPGFFAILP